MAHKITGASLTPIYEQLNRAPTYHPLEAETFADWSIEAGDIVTVSRDGNSYQSPVQNTSLTWKKGQQVSVSSGGNESREAVSKVSQHKYNGGIGGGAGLRNDHYQNLQTYDMYYQMTAGLELAGSSLALYVRDKYDEMSSGLKLTSSSAAMYVRDNYLQMTAGLELTSSSAAMYVRDNYLQMTAGLELTSSSAAMYVHDNYSQMTSGLKLTSSSAAMYVHDKYNEMTSGLKLTSSSAAIYVQDKYNEMTSGLKLTSSSAAMYVRDNYLQMTAGLKLTSSSAAMYVHDMYSEMKSGLALTSSSAAVYVQDLYNQMKSGLDVTSSSAAIYVNGKTNRAYIMATINAKGESGVVIHADVIDIQGVVQALVAYDISCGDLTCGSIRCTDIDTDGGIYGQTIGGDFILCDEEYLNVADVQVSGNTLTITYTDGSTATFSKATSLSGEWSSTGTYTVTAKQNNVTVGTKAGIITGTSVSGTPTLNESNSKYVDATITVSAKEVGESGTGSVVYSSTKSINATVVYNAGFDAVAAPTVTFDSVSSGSTDTSPSGKAEISAKTDGTARRTGISMTLSRSTYTSSGTSYPCVDLTYSGNVVGRISTSAVFNDGGKTAHAKVTSVSSVSGTYTELASDTYYRIRPYYTAASGTETAVSSNDLFVKTPAITVDNWVRTAFPSNTSHSASHAFDIPISVDVNGVTYTHTFTTPLMRLEYVKVGTVDTYALICGNTTIYRFEV